MKEIFLNILTKEELYLDPGSGSLIIQLLLAGLLGIGVAIRIYWDKLKGFFAKRNEGEIDESDPTALNEDLEE